MIFDWSRHEPRLRERKKRVFRGEDFGEKFVCGVKRGYGVAGRGWSFPIMGCRRAGSKKEIDNLAKLFECLRLVLIYPG